MKSYIAYEEQRTCSRAVPMECAKQSHNAHHPNKSCVHRMNVMNGPATDALERELKAMRSCCSIDPLQACRSDPLAVPHVVHFPMEVACKYDFPEIAWADEVYEESRKAHPQATWMLTRRNGGCGEVQTRGLVRSRSIPERLSLLETGVVENPFLFEPTALRLKSQKCPNASRLYT
jgi:hypothetical protein